jgi:hypothetical protein
MLSRISFVGSAIESLPTPGKKLSLKVPELLY